MLDHAPFPATASAEGAHFNVPPSLVVGEGPPLMRRPSADTVAGNGWDSPPPSQGRVDWVLIPRGLLTLLRHRGE